MNIEKIKQELESGLEIVFSLEEWDIIGSQLAHHYHYSEWVLETVWEGDDIIANLVDL